jgi:tetratricopeptide (TPR) repeat protein
MTEDATNDATELLERIAYRDPSSPLYLPLAERMREQGRVDEAIRLCEERRGRPGQGVGDRIVLGRCYLAAGRLTEARGQFEAAVQLDRENVVALKALAGILSHEGQHGAASDFYRAVCRIDPGDLESQSALHQITSGEFPEVRPPDLVVAQGEVTWQPVLPPREEEYLGEISLGLHTIESFDADAPKPYEANVQDFQEMAFDALDVEHTAPPEVTVEAEAPAASVAAPEAAVPEAAAIPEAAAAAAPEVAAPEARIQEAAVPEAAAPEAAAPEASATEASATEAAIVEPTADVAHRWIEIPKASQPRPEPSGPPKVEQNKSAFETWLSRLKGRP